MKSRLAPVMIAAALLSAAGAPGAIGSQAGTEATAAAAAKRCAEVDIGFTSADVRARNISCRKARRFLYRWARQDRTCNEANEFCRVTRRAGFRCVRGGSEITVTLYCRRGDQRIKGSWGD